MNNITTIIIGGGPAGLFCSLLLAKTGCPVLLLEKMHTCGRKLLISGSGQCNLTHTGTIPSFLNHYGEHGKFIRSALMHFPNHELIRFFEEQGIEFTENEEGKIFPKSGKSRDILTALLNEADNAGVRIQVDEPVQKITHHSDEFVVTTKLTEYHSPYVVLATGGFTYPVTGSTGDGYLFAQEMGHKIIQPGPALAPVYIPEFPFGELSGISFSGARLSVFRDNKKMRETVGDILITHKGLSGPGILDLSRYIRDGDELKVSFLPYQNNANARDELTGYFSSGGIKLVKTMLSSLHLPERFARKIMEVTQIPSDITCAQFSKQLRNRLITFLLEYTFSDVRLGDQKDAMVTRGGIALDEIKQDSMESKIIPGLFCIGETLDIDGDCGGYNLQAAFSTGALAASGIHKKITGKKISEK